MTGQLLTEAIDQADQDEGDEEDWEFHGAVWWTEFIATSLQPGGRSRSGGPADHLSMDSLGHWRAGEKREKVSGKQLEPRRTQTKD